MTRLRHGITERAPPTGSFSLRALGTLDLRRQDGTAAEAVLSQPKRFALLVYLIVAKRGSLCRRDTVLGVFWPDFDQERARAALRKALHFLRTELGHDVIIGRGDDEIGVDPLLMSSDVGEFASAYETGDMEAALGLYSGDFLDGFYIGAAPEFEQWTEATRRELGSQAVRAAERLTQNALDAHDPRSATPWAREWVRLAPTDETATRALMTAFDGVGERASALGAYDVLAGRLRDLGLEPSTETQILASAIRQKNGELSVEPANAAAAAVGPGRARPRRRLLTVGAAVIALFLAVIALTPVCMFTCGGSPAEIEARWIIVAEFDGSANRTIRDAAHSLMTVALDQSPAWEVLPASQIARGKAIAEKPDTARLTEDLALDLARLGRIPIVVVGQVDRVGATYALSFRAVESDSGTAVSAIREIAENDDDVIFKIDAAARVLVADLQNGPRPDGPTHRLWDTMTPEMEALQKYRRATDISLDLSAAELDKLLLQAVAIDSTFSQAWLRLAYRLAQRRQPDSTRAAVRAALSRPERLHGPQLHYA